MVGGGMRANTETSRSSARAGAPTTLSIVHNVKKKLKLYATANSVEFILLDSNNDHIQRTVPIRNILTKYPLVSYCGRNIGVKPSILYFDSHNLVMIYKW